MECGHKWQTNSFYGNKLKHECETEGEHQSHVCGACGTVENDDYMNHDYEERDL